MRRLAALLFVPLVLVGCSQGSTTPLCAGRVSIADWVLQFGQGLANFDDSASMSLQVDSVSILDVALAARDSDEEAAAAAVGLSTKIATFVAVMNSHDWLVSVALEDDKAIAAADALANEESLRQANTIESLILSKCPSVSTLAPPVATYDTLPAPSVPSPTATDPPDNGQKDASEATALGIAVGTAFGITMSAEQVTCVGTQLQGVVDATQAMSGPGQYTAQFQSAFDACGVDFMVPQS